MSSSSVAVTCGNSVELLQRSQVDCVVAFRERHRLGTRQLLLNLMIGFCKGVYGVDDRVGLGCSGPNLLSHVRNAIGYSVRNVGKPVWTSNAAVCDYSGLSVEWDERSPVRLELDRAAVARYLLRCGYGRAGKSYQDYKLLHGLRHFDIGRLAQPAGRVILMVPGGGSVSLARVAV
jgi:hypothetical protein